jgi:hypothetical protein
MSSRLDQAFRLAAGELGMATAAWLFAEQASGAGGETELAALRDGLGRAWPVLDAVCEAWAGGQRPGQPDVPSLASVLNGIGRLVVVGLETRWMDALLPALADTTRVAMVRHGLLPADWQRVVGNYGGRLELLGLDDFQAWAGPRSALLTFVYGQEQQGRVFVMPDWLRVQGPDVRLQFRDLVGWNILPHALPVYPRWLVAEEPSVFTCRLTDHGTPRDAGRVAAKAVIQ